MLLSEQSFIRGVVHTQIGCTDFKFSKNILDLLDFFRSFGFFRIFRIFLGGCTRIFLSEQLFGLIKTSEKWKSLQPACETHLMECSSPQSLSRNRIDPASCSFDCSAVTAIGSGSTAFFRYGCCLATASLLTFHLI